MGIFFELLWLDLFPAGTYIPPNAMLASTVTLSVLACVPDAGMRATAALIVATLPMAYLAPWLEQLYRKRQNLSYNSLTTWNRRGIAHAYTPQRLVLQALAELFLLNLFLFQLCALPALLALRYAQPWLAQGVAPTWGMLWMAAAAGAILALRQSKAYALAGASLVLGVLVSL